MGKRQGRDKSGRFTGTGTKTSRERSRRSRSAPGRGIGDHGSRSTTTGAVGGGDLGAAAEEIAKGARERAAAWSSEIPLRIEVEVSGDVATISCDAPAAYPNEVDGVRHPTFGHDPWVRNEHRPFLGPAADERAGAAMARYADKIDKMVRARGFK